ncbi:hypothetical protein BDP27DRAFT_1423631 [Rhodocollybia butyracea]|uniref:Uncharacterized protein n=1 Tax=Rhodocollybia butyracea TaxID=206335 RepID=A0A9P5PIZ8_9AGAR|nr:hypothetical protein BDP27DRAFT_1423631 [Rhodocollybia butyracea]
MSASGNCLAKQFAGARLPKLTDKECDLLKSNNRCFKYHKPFTSCITSSKNHDYNIPSGENYKELTQSDIDSMKTKSKGKGVDCSTNLSTVAGDVSDNVIAVVHLPSTILGAAGSLVIFK